MTAFREKIREQIANQPLQAALDANAARRISGYTAAFASLPDWRERRQRAHAVRAEVIEHLEQYLAQFSARVEANGVTVHRAGDAAQAVQTVLDIIAVAPRKREPVLGKGESDAEQGGISVHPRMSASHILIAKSKSMVSEEIELNHALEAAGHRVVETDLGEYIVQLRGERPAHIIAPAVHLRRHDVGQLFHEKLGVPYTDDIPALTNTARRVLREVFLNADAGISGVNFGVAETGGLCIVTNEGNGRMVTTLPPVHIALMGIERLVPRLDDLALMLSLLPRAATGQKLSVYTQLIHAPLDGQQRHVILLDNGRTGLRDSPLRESLYCIRCGACLNACPVFREIGGHGYLGDRGTPATYSGPIGSVISAGLGGDGFGSLAQASSLCGACREACPVDIDLPKLLLRVRAGQAKVTGGQLPVIRGQSSVARQKPSEKEPAGGVGLSPTIKLALRVYTWIARYPRLFSFAQRILGWLSAPLPGFLRLPPATGWGLSKDLPKPAANPFRARWRGLSKQVAGEPAGGRQGTSGEVASGHGRGDGEENAQVFEGDPSLPASFSTEALVGSFIQELAAVGGHGVRIHREELHQKVIDLLHSREISRIQAQPRLLDESILRAAGVSCSSLPDPTIRAGVTGAVCGLADTGSIIVSDGAGGPLEASLLPEVHIAVVRTADILPSLADAFARAQIRASRAAVVITGPSRTGDIEMSHTIGVHGPGEVHVFVVDD
jgi:L-lactate dehydrogenase complex protein LldF